MSGSYRLQKKQIRDSRKLNQPPQLLSSGLLSSHDRSEFHQERINELSNVQEKSYISSEASGHDKQDFKEFIAHIQPAADPFEQPASPIRKKKTSIIPRIEDHDIIVVQEQNEICSNSGGRQSVILEQVDFNSDQKQPEETPEWQNPQNNYKHEGINYIINYVQAPHNFLVNQNEYVSSSSPNDFSTTQIKQPKVRNSKNTCIQRTNSRDSNHVKNFKPANKSCITQAINRVSSKESSSPQSSKQLDFIQILNKWNNQVYPQLSNEYIRKDTILPPQEQRRNTISYDMQKQAKYCMSQYQNPNSRFHDFSQLKSTNKGKQDKQIQTQSATMHFSHTLSTQKIRNLQQQVRRYEEQNFKLKVNQKQLLNELNQLRENLSLKSEEIQNLRSTLQHTNLSRNRLYIDESKRMESKNKQLQKIITDQNFTIRVFEQKQDDLQKKLHETVSYLQKSVQMRPFQSKSMQFDQLNVFEPAQSKRFQSNTHQACNAKIQALQEYIFDFEQKKVGIDIQVERRLQRTKDQLQMQLKRNISEQYKMILAGLKQEISRLKEINARLVSEKSDLAQKSQKRQKDLIQRQEIVKKMYDQLVNQWNDVGNQNNRQYQKSVFVKSNNPSLISPRGATKTYEHLFSHNHSDQNFKKYDSPQKQNFYSSKNLFSPTNQKSNLNLPSNFGRDSSIKYLKEYESMPPLNMKSPSIEKNIGGGGYQRMTFGKDTKYKSKEFEQSYQIRQNNDLYVINSKIQRLRSQINRQLDLIH